MKEILVSWYGITDFKSSLGIEESGPLLGALKAAAYTEIQILGYTDSNKNDFNSQEKFNTELHALNKEDREESNSFVYQMGEYAVRSQAFY